MSLYPLGEIIEVVESISVGPVPMKVSYAYEDLVFMEHNAFLLQFTPKADEVLVHTNIAADMDEVKEPIAALKTAAAGRGITISDGSFYRLDQAHDQNVTIKFMEKKQDVSHD